MIQDLAEDIQLLKDESHHLTLDELVFLEELVKELDKIVYDEMSLRMHTRGRSSKRLIDSKGIHVDPMSLNRQG